LEEEVQGGEGGKEEEMGKKGKDGEDNPLDHTLEGLDSGEKKGGKEGSDVEVQEGKGGKKGEIDHISESEEEDASEKEKGKLDDGEGKEGLGEIDNKSESEEDDGSEKGKGKLGDGERKEGLDEEVQKGKGGKKGETNTEVESEDDDGSKTEKDKLGDGERKERLDEEVQEGKGGKKEERDNKSESEGNDGSEKEKGKLGSGGGNAGLAVAMVMEEGLRGGEVVRGEEMMSFGDAGVAEVEEKEVAEENEGGELGSGLDKSIGEGRLEDDGDQLAYRSACRGLEAKGLLPVPTFEVWLHIHSTTSSGFRSNKGTKRKASNHAVRAAALERKHLKLCRDIEIVLSAHNQSGTDSPPERVSLEVWERIRIGVGLFDD
jgi:hypothetical protein